MKSITKTQIAPIVSTLFLAIGYVTGHKFDTNTIDFWTTITAAVATSAWSIWGIVKDHQKGEGK